MENITPGLNDDRQRHCGKEINDIRYKLLEVRKNVEHQKLLPKKVRNYLEKAIDYMEDFRNHVEDEMYKRGGPKDTTIWCPGANSPKEQKLSI